MLGKFLGFGRVYGNKFFFCFLNMEINLEVFEILFKKIF